MSTQKQQIIERLTKANNVLITVKNDPTVDQLAAAIGFSLALNALDKHATAVYSGETPSVIEFLHPEENIEKTTDSLRDFIISLDKEKADKLRYKVEDQVVRIFITPYRTSISDKDLEFSQGDFNVDAVVALGVHSQSEIDQAVTAHGRILHDATVITITNDQASDLGALNLFDEAASSLSEVVAGLTLALGDDVLDGQISTALLTGIVSETERFGNARTTAETMRLSSTLLASGADQQLVATKLEPEPEPAPAPIPEPIPEPEPVVAPEPEPAPAPEPEPEAKPIEAPTPEPEPEPEPEEASAEIHIDANGTLQITHEPRRATPKDEPAAPATPAPEPAPVPAPVAPAVPDVSSPVPSAELPAAENFTATTSDQAVAETPAAPAIVQTTTNVETPIITPTDADELSLPELPKPSTDHPAITHSFAGNRAPALEDPESHASETSAGELSAPSTPSVPMMSHGGASPAATSSPAEIEQATVDAARDAVLQAMGTHEQAANDVPLPPITALNAQPLGTPLHEEETPQTMTLPVPGNVPPVAAPQAPTEASSAPPVPPPLPFTPPTQR